MVGLAKILKEVDPSFNIPMYIDSAMRRDTMAASDMKVIRDIKWAIERDLNEITAKNLRKQKIWKLFSFWNRYFPYFF